MGFLGTTGGTGDDGRDGSPLTISSVAAYGWGGIALASALLFRDQPVAMAFLGASGAVVFPPTRRLFERAVGTRLGRWVVVGLAALLWVIGASMVG